MAPYSEFLRSASGDSEMPEVLTWPVRDLPGVSADAVAALADVGVRAVSISVRPTCSHRRLPPWSPHAPGRVSQPLRIDRGRPPDRRGRPF
jgi:hypothetical protein